jgi:beta-phosphoglucomutase-like phosphatase (HAD superfamily)
MLSVTLICVGKMKEKFYIEAAAEYVKRLGAYCKLNIVELPEQKLSQNPSRGEIDAALAKEAEAIRASVLAPFFDVMMLSCEQGVQKPEREIFERCLAKLSVAPEDCLYVGDGGSFELETARSFGMKTLQAGWFVKNYQEDWKKEGFASATAPEEVLAAAEA